MGSPIQLQKPFQWFPYRRFQEPCPIKGSAVNAPNILRFRVQDVDG
jgi:hypothetical protein